MVPESTVIRFVPTGAIPLIDVPVAVTMTCSGAPAAELSCADAWPAIASVIAVTDAPHRSFFTTRESSLELKNIDAIPSLSFFGPTRDADHSLRTT